MGLRSSKIEEIYHNRVETLMKILKILDCRSIIQRSSTFRTQKIAHCSDVDDENETPIVMPLARKC